MDETENKINTELKLKNQQKRRNGRQEARIKNKSSKSYFHIMRGNTNNIRYNLLFYNSFIDSGKNWET